MTRMPVRSVVKKAVLLYVSRLLRPIWKTKPFNLHFYQNQDKLGLDFVQYCTMALSEVQLRLCQVQEFTRAQLC